jgi:hypothetical protein
MADGPIAVEAAAAGRGARGASRAAAPPRFALRPQPRAVLRPSGDEDEEMDDDEDDGVEAGKVRPRKPARRAARMRQLRGGSSARLKLFVRRRCARRAAREPAAPGEARYVPRRLRAWRGVSARRRAARRASV